MNKKKLMLVVASIVMGAVSAVTFTACESGNEPEREAHTHEYVWGDIITPPTCEETGEQKGVCPVDNDTTTREVPATGHDWGNWIITPPNESDTGLAVKNCKNDTKNEHSVKVILPALTNEEAYTVEDEGNGEHLYTYAHELGNISFSVTPKTQENYTVEEAVNFGTAELKHELVRSGEGIIGGGRLNDAVPVTSDFSYTYGDGYVYVNDGSMRQERYYQKDDAEPKGLFAVAVSGSSVTIDTNATINNLIGPEFYLTFVTHNDRYYGVENLVKGFYDWSQSNGMFDVHYDDPGEKDGKELVFSFGFSFIDVNYNSYLQVVSVDFTLNTSNVIDWVSVQSYSYVQSEYTFNEEAGYVPTANANPSLGKIVMTQTMKSEDDEEPDNPYAKDKIFISEVKYTLNGKDLEDGATITSTADTAISGLAVKEILPSTAISSLDKVTAYYVDENGDEQLCDWWGTTVTYFFDTSTKAITLRATVKGDFVIKLRTAYSVFTLNLHSEAVAPSVLNPYIYTYSEASDSYQGSMFSAATIYVGKPLMLTATVNNPNTEEAGYTVSLRTPSGANYAITEGTYNDVAVSVFTAETAGSYSIKLTSTKSSSISTTITVTVLDLPDFSETLNGSYEYKANDTVVSFTPDSEGALTGTVVIEDTAGTETLTYSCEGDVITLEHVSGANLGYGLSFNDVYTLVLTKDDGFETHNYLLTKIVEEGELSPEDAIKNTDWGNSSKNSNNFITFYDNGTCKVGRAAMCFTASYTLGEMDADGNMKLTFSNVVNGSTMTQYAITQTGANSGSYITVQDGVVVSVTIVYVDGADTLTIVI